VNGQDPDVLVVEVHPGTGVVSRHDDALIVVPAFQQQHLPSVRALLEICARGPDPSGRSRARAVAALLSETDPDDVPGFALVLGTESDVTVLAHGGVELTVRGIAQETFSGTDSLAWVERRVKGRLSYLRVTASGAPASGPSGLPFSLVAGTVPGSGATLDRRLSATGQRSERLVSAAAGPAEPVPAAANAARPVLMPTVSQTMARPVRAFESVLLQDASGERSRPRTPLPVEDVDVPAPVEQAPLVEGIDCPAGHFNDPQAGNCRSCGMILDERNSPRRTGRRPTLGVLVTDNGSVFSLDCDYVIGRAPERDEAVLVGTAQALVLRDVGQSVSRVHAYLALSGWQVLLVDRGSANGTFVSKAGPSGPWERVSADRQTAITPGTRVRIGARQLIYERYHQNSSSSPAGRGG